jgi:hypothetical protein
MRKNFFLFLVILFLLGCQNTKEDIIIKPFKFLLLKTSYEKDKIEIDLFDKEWKMTQKIPLSFGGLGGVLQRKIKQHNNRIYIIALGATSNPLEKILEINLKSGRSRFLKTDKFPTDLEVLNEKLYVVHNSNINSSTVVSIDLDGGKIIKKVELDGVLPAISPVKDGYFYITTENPPKGNQKIYKLDLNLKVSPEITNNKTIGNTDFLFGDKNLMLFNKNKANLRDPTILLPADQYLKLDKENRESYVQLSEISPYQAFDAGSSIIITHSFPNNQSGHVTRINKETQKQEVFKLASTVLNSSVQGDRLYVLGNSPETGGSAEKMYEYQLSDFQLKKVIKLPLDKDLVLSGIFVHP